MAAKVKPVATRKVINEAVDILQALGVPLASATPRQREMAGMCFLAVSGVTHSADWPSAGRLAGAPLGTRQIIDFINQHFGESISKGSYDDIRRKHLKGAILAGIVIQSASKPNAAANDPTRGYGLHQDCVALVRAYGETGWAGQAAKFMDGRTALTDLVGGKKGVEPVVVVMPDGNELRLGPGWHNVLQRAIVEQFRPRFAHGAKVLYLGDAEDRALLVEKDELEALCLALPTSGSLPDVVLWDESKRWLYLIEAVHASGAISPSRLLELEKLTCKCEVSCVYVTAFLDRSTFRKMVAEIAWETEVWIAEEPDHMIHFNGDRFFGPRNSFSA